MLERQIALVTGSGQGIGKAIALQLAQSGAKAVFSDINPDTMNSAVEEAKAMGLDAIGIACDISDAESRSRLIESIERECGRLDLLVNNAGVGARVRADMLELAEENYDWLMDINLKGPYFLTQALAKKMIEWKKQDAAAQPRIVFITSISSYTVSISRAEYCISKAGLTMAAQLFAVRMAEYNIPVLEIRPGIIETPMTRVVKDKYEKLIADGLLPTKRMGQPEDIAKVVCAIARGDLDYCTGESIEVGGGFGLTRL
ncbi:3-ketoacyl-ACP reductase [Candidatus Sumerlaeota bacterium]|nr:3-ketoacyl-ACP reductase [Candidatus Sumerlaeota bacterium]